MGSRYGSPRVLEMSDIDPTVYSGFAFGLGQSVWPCFITESMISVASEDIRLQEQFK